MGLRKVNLKEQADVQDKAFLSRLGTFSDHNIGERSCSQKLMATVHRGKWNSNKTTAKGATFMNCFIKIGKSHVFHEEKFGT